MTSGVPAVSVLLPVRKPSEQLNIAVSSLLAQTLADFELLIIGYQGIEEWQAKLPEDDRIRPLVRPAPGIVNALNHGLAQARGQLIARMDADDISHPERLALQVQHLRSNPDIALCGCLVDIQCAGSTKGLGHTHYQEWLNNTVTPESISRNIFVESPIPHPTWMATKNTLKSLIGWRDVSWAEDYDLLLRAHLAGIRMGKVNKLLFTWNDHQGRLTRTDPRYSRQNFFNAKAWALAQSIAKGRSIIICGTGRNARWLHDALQANSCDIHCFIERDDAPARTAKRHLPVYTYQQLFDFRKDELVVSAVTAWGARDELRHLFQSRGWLEGDDFVIAG